MSLKIVEVLLVVANIFGAILCYLQIKKLRVLINDVPYKYSGTQGQIDILYTFLFYQICVVLGRFFRIFSENHEYFDILFIVNGFIFHYTISSVIYTR